MSKHQLKILQEIKHYETMDRYDHLFPHYFAQTKNQKTFNNLIKENLIKRMRKNRTEGWMVTEKGNELLKEVM